MSKLIIKKLIVKGTRYQRTIDFSEKITIISGDKTSGKSLILSLIDYCLGKSSKIDLKVQLELANKCDEVFLEIMIEEEVLTLKRSLKKNFSKIYFYYCEYNKIEAYTPKILDVKDVMKILMNKLEVNEYKLIRHKKHSNKKEIDTISFRDIFRYVYIHQHELGTNDFLSKKDKFKSNKNPYAFQMMFNLVDNDKDSLNEQLVQIQNEIDETKRELYGLNAYIKDLDALDEAFLQSKYNQLENKIKRHQLRKNIILKRSVSKSNGNNENKMYITLKEEINLINDKIIENNMKKNDLGLSIESKKILIVDYETELREIEATMEINYKLRLSQQKIECPLCSSTVEGILHKEISEDVITEKALINIEKQFLNKIKLVNNLINKEQDEIVKLDKENELLIDKKSIYDKAIIEYSQNTDVPFLSQIDGTNSIISSLVKKQESIKEGLKIHHKIDEKEKHIEGLKVTEARLIKLLEGLKVDGKVKKEIFDFLDKKYKAFMKRFKYDSSNDTTYIDRNEMIPYYNGASVYSHESGGLLECMQLSFLGAILESKTEGYAEGHPGLLLLDSISKYVGTLNEQDAEDVADLEDELTEKINDPEVYEEFYKILIELSNKHQIILVENTPPEKYYKKYAKYTFYTGDRGLIDESKNELKDL